MRREAPFSINAFERPGSSNGATMRPAPFEYHRAETLEHALRLLADFGDEGRVLAGGYGQGEGQREGEAGRRRGGGPHRYWSTKQ